jgi:hypothetical protein
MVKKIALVVLVILGLIQFVSTDKMNPVTEIENDFIQVTSPPTEVANALKSACYDCHSNESKYPWYSYVAPVSWWVKDHIDEGREELNFSEWNSFSDKRKAKKLKEVIEEVEEGEMPLPPYLITHSEANLTPEQKQALVDWFKYLKMKG